jgi:hypothetical protein
MAQIATVAYSKELQKQLFPSNEFYKNSIAETGIAADAETFEIPNLSDIEDAIEGKPTVLPLQVKTADDKKVTGTMKTFYANPLLITDPEEIVLNYSKRQNKQLQQAAAINTKAADYALYQWSPALKTRLVAATGAARTTSVTGLSGTRLAVQKVDILRVWKKFQSQNAMSVPGELYGLLTPDAAADLMGVLDVDFFKAGNSDMILKGIIGILYGIKLMVRSKPALYDASDGRLKTVGTAATDRPASLFWHSGMVCHAEAHAKTYVNADDATYMGTIISSSVRFGAEKCREDEAGVVALYEAKPA